MDCLTFGAKIMLKNFNSKGEPITQIFLEDLLKELELNLDEFIDLCIMCGCDYCDSIDGVGPMTAYKLIKEHRSIDKVVAALEEEMKSSKNKR
jgi:flap endonuclease-1